MPTPIPPKAAIERSVAELKKLYTQIDAEVGGKLGTADGKLSDDEIKTFADTCASTPAAGEAVVALQRYLKNVARDDEVPLETIDKVLGKVPGYIEKARAEADDVDQMKPTWRAVALFAQELKTIGGQVSGGAGSDPEKATTREAFATVDDDVKVSVLERWGDLRDHYVAAADEVSIDSLSGEQLKFARSMEAKLLDIIGDFEDDSGVYGTVGGPRAEVSIITTPSGEIVGGNVSISQQGFNHDIAEDPDDPDADIPWHFDTAAALDGAGLGVGAGDDVSWGISGLFQTDDQGEAAVVGDPWSNVSDHWEWSGH